MFRGKIVVVGAGFVGSTTAYTIMLGGLFSEIVIIDINRDKAEGDALDMAHGVSLKKPVNVYAGDYSDCKDADIVVITAGASQSPGETRLDLLKKNAVITKSITENVMKYADALKANGVEVEEISWNFFDLANTAWQILMCAETCNNVSRYDGVKYGHRTEQYRNIDELYVKSRTEGFNFLTKAVILYGSDVLSKNRYKDCYDKSLRVRRVIADATKELLEKYDAILAPVCSKTEYTAYDIKDAFTKVFEESVFTALPNLIGTPALVSGGVQLMGKHFDESVLLSLANSVERKGE